MATEIKTWEIINNTLHEIDSSLESNGLREKDHLENWIKTHPEILGSDILIFGEQVYTKSGPLDFIGVDNEGNLVIIELKRDKLPREVIAQVIDYASDVDNWGVDKLNEISQKYHQKGIEEVFSEKFEMSDDDDKVFNNSQRILLVGFGVAEPLNRMIDWLSQKYDLAINAIILNYSKTSSGNEVLSRTVIIPEDVEKEKTGRRKRSKSFFKQLFELGKLKEGDELIFYPAIEQENENKYDKNDDRIRATVVDQYSTNCLKRKGDDKVYSFSRMRYMIIEELELKGIRKSWGFGQRNEWGLIDGRRLADL